MLAPKKVKFRKSHKGRIKGIADRCNSIDFGDFALQAVEPGKLEARQIEASRIALTRHIKRGGKVWIRVFPDKPITKKPAETRMGSGKGGLDRWVCPIRSGRVIFEIQGVPANLAQEAFELAAAKLPFKTRMMSRSDKVWENQ
ncbi:50S ribosomal protein L16 [Fluviispira multicolorata]|uniref:Large ribosomal subunit protein uL16 n=1 Tax=Fluviispira multicolorata TaxID=2654512 RepID=A0A833N3A5_9BACT|nr:50S ribosomal protein L16 [Fluviispira multicolorata]KAB8029744.1 50S ribosomal protein L16 [Fluviispira multicolorata]